MKYIMFEREINGLKHRIPIIFPNNLVHLDVAKALILVVNTKRIIGAGEINLGVINCSGNSTTIGIKSKNEIDRKIINNIDYTGGIEGALEIL